MSVPATAGDRMPSAANGHWLFAWGSGAFLVALILGTIAMPTSGVSPDERVISPEARLGRAVFNGEGCMECHSRMVRGGDRGMGAPASEQLLAVMDASPGSTRIGPDLQNLDRRYPRSILETRLNRPDALQPGTVMPSYAHLGPVRKDALVKYLELQFRVPSGWEAVRARNRIEDAVPDEVLVSLREYVDDETGYLVLPIQETPEYLITGRGIYNSRCAACHGLTGRGDGPMAWHAHPAHDLFGGPSPVVPPANFTDPRYADWTPVMLYWRIAEGVPGTSMPAWGGKLSEDAMWFLVGYVRSMARVSGAGAEVEVSPDETELEVTDFAPDWFVEDFLEEYLGPTSESVETPAEESPDEESQMAADGASEEEGTSTNEGQASDDATQSAENIAAGEDTL